MPYLLLLKLVLFVLKLVGARAAIDGPEPLATFPIGVVEVCAEVGTQLLHLLLTGELVVYHHSAHIYHTLTSNLLASSLQIQALNLDQVVHVAAWSILRIPTLHRCHLRCLALW